MISNAPAWRDRSFRHKSLKYPPSTDYRENNRGFACSAGALDMLTYSSMQLFWVSNRKRRTNAALLQINRRLLSSNCIWFWLKKIKWKSRVNSKKNCFFSKKNNFKTNIEHSKKNKSKSSFFRVLTRVITQKKLKKNGTCFFWLPVALDSHPPTLIQTRSNFESQGRANSCIFDQPLS